MEGCRDAVLLGETPNIMYFAPFTLFVVVVVFFLL